ncbi:MAG TPA: serine/threonine-protein kinase, partial [Myxococcota bacterium]
MAGADDKEQRDTLTGTTLAGRYQIVRPLAAGGMGAVYVAVQHPLEREVALKVLKPSLLGDPVAVNRFKEEARIVSRIEHPNIIAIHDSGVTDDGVLFIAMTLVHGKSLGALVREVGALPWQRSLPIVVGIARALEAAHLAHVVHRDLKPDNILLVDLPGMHDFVKVLDFGIAKAVNRDAQPKNLTGTGFVPGTPGYIAPEQIASGSSDDPRSDLYALGVTWFEMLTGAPPFTGDSAMQIFLAHLQQPVPTLAEKLPGLVVPEPLQLIIASLLAKDPAQRPQDASALIARLEATGLLGTPTPARQPQLDPAAIHASTMATMTSVSTPGTSVRAFMTPPPQPASTSAVSASSSSAASSAASASALLAQTGTATAATPHAGTTPPPTGFARISRQTRIAIAAAAVVVAALAFGVGYNYIA